MNHEGAGTVIERRRYSRDKSTPVQFGPPVRFLVLLYGDSDRRSQRSECSICHRVGPTAVGGEVPVWQKSCLKGHLLCEDCGDWVGISVRHNNARIRAHHWNKCRGHYL